LPPPPGPINNTAMLVRQSGAALELRPGLQYGNDFQVGRVGGREEGRKGGKR
jgi:hypothetical protein